MNFQQLRSLRETVRQKFNLTDVARVLHTSQPAISRQIREIEDELGVEIFVRSGKRLMGLTGPGATVMPIVERMLREAENLRRASADYAKQGRGHLVIAATHSQARYALPTSIRDFRATNPDVLLQIRQGSPQQVANMLLDGEADIGIATEALADHEALVTLPCFSWTHVLVVPHDHVLVGESAPSLERLAQFPLVTYEPGYTGRRHIDEAFAAEQLSPEIVLTAMDADVVKTYVELGLGVGIIAAIAYDADRDRRLAAIEARHLFAANTTRLAVRRGDYLRDYAYRFIERFSPLLTRDVVDDALAGRTTPRSNAEPRETSASPRGVEAMTEPDR